MAQRYSIKVMFDAPVSLETLDRIAEELLELDYDFPRGCLTSGDFTSYRSPMIPDADMVTVFLKHGAEGQYWMSSESDPYSATENDGDVVVFRTGGDPDSVAEAHRKKTMAEATALAALRYVTITQAFKVPALPIVWEATALLYLYVRDETREAFEAEVRRLTEESR